METYPKGTLVNKLHHSDLPVFNLKALQTIFNTKSRATLNAIIKRLADQQILTLIVPGLYALTDKQPDKFLIANHLNSPSYISFESALNYHGILPQFPFIITSATINKPQEKDVSGITYQYLHLQSNLFFGYTSKNHTLIATPEKALLDQLYYATKKYRLVDWDEYSLDLLNQSRLREYLKLYHQVKGYKIIETALMEHNLC
jgi:predicted transcriptional regulator of viral defense system